jgi:hypothetical protein
VCKRHCHNTQLKGIVACLAKDNYDPLYNATFQASFVSEHEDFGAQMAYQFLKDRLQMHRSFHEVAMALCNLQRQIFHNKLQAVASGNGPYALLDLYGPGHSFVVAGAVAYITTCVELAATPASYSNCTAEIPVMWNKTRYFADPFNFVLHTVATILPCSTVTPVKWKIAGEWKCSTPDMIDCPSPLQLNTSIMISEPYPQMTVGLGRGLYSPAQMAIHRTLIRAIQAQCAASQVIATAFSESSVNWRGSIISSIDLDMITTTVGFLFFPLFHLVGRWYATAIGILIGLYITKLLFCAAWRVIVTGRQRGCGPWLILAILESGFTIVRSPYFLMEETMRRLLRGVDEIASSEDSVPSSEAHFRRMLNRLKNKHTASQIAARHQQVFQHRRLRRMNNIMVAEAAAAEPALPERSHAEFCSEFPDLSNEYLSLVHIDNQRADIELQRRKEDLQDNIRTKF